jgi:tRNA threonylcarbamoyladenosine biosynthesis protein TsaB
MYLCIKTDSPEAEIYLSNSNQQTVDSITWQAHRDLSNSLLPKIEAILKINKFDLQSIKGIVVYSGPGSFTGLRIGVSFANTLAYSLGVPVIGLNGIDWLAVGVDRLCSGIGSGDTVVPNYGSDARITTPKK